MMTREEMMAKVANFSDGELEGAIRSVELQREITEEMKKDVNQRKEDLKCRLSDIDVTVIGAVKADSLSELMTETTKMQKALEEGSKEAPEGAIVIREFLVNAGNKINTCNFTIDFKLTKDQINEMNNKIGRVFF